jgi:hypothetical protein
MNISDDSDFLEGSLTTDIRVQNFKNYIQFTKIGSTNIDEPLNINTLQLKKFLA